jgi:hypothetical protein
MRKYVSLYELLNMVRGIEDLQMEDDNTFLKKRYIKIKEIYDKSRILGHVPKHSYKIIENIDNEILKYIGVDE